MDSEKMGRFLKELRKEKGLTQEQFAEEMQVNNRTISRWENGSNLPDISLLTDIADFYRVDVRELIEGERRSNKVEEKEVVREEVASKQEATPEQKAVADTAQKMAEYAGQEKSKLLKWVQVISFIGVVLAGIAVFLFCNFQDTENPLWFVGLGLMVLVLVALIILTLYVTGVLDKLNQKKKLGKAIKITAIVIGGVCVTNFLGTLLCAVLIVVIPFVFNSKATSGIENYDKQGILEEYRGDLDSGLYLFPDDTTKLLDPEYACSMTVGLFDTDGYIILKARYTEADYEAEVERLSKTTCKIERTTYDSFFSSEGKYDSMTLSVQYNEGMYNYPAYIASDGYDYSYEYALLDEENHTIIYVYLSYPEYLTLSLAGYEDYLKKDALAYSGSSSGALENFTIYAYQFPDDSDCWYEFGD